MTRIAFTFNDDPVVLRENGVVLGTSELLRVLEELSAEWGQPVQATFFAVGRYLQRLHQESPEIIERLIEGGHEIGNHSFSKLENFHKLPIKTVLKEVHQTHDLIEEIFGFSPKFFRPPHGLLSLEAERAILKEFPSYQIVGWDHHPEKSGDTPVVLRQRILSKAHDQQVILLHSWRQATLWGIRHTLRELKSQNYNFVSLSHLERPLPRNGIRRFPAPQPHRPCIALTFDDDPKVFSTPAGVKLGTLELMRVIDELNKSSLDTIRVTFFVVGVNIEKAIIAHSDLIESMKSGGHEIQNHSYSHPANFHQLSPQQAVDEVGRNHELIMKTFQQEPRFFRPPNGLICPANKTAILKAFPQYQICGWDRHDEKSSYSAEQLRRQVVSSSQDQQIVLLHAWYQTTLWAMRGIFTDLRARQYQLVNMSDIDRQPTLYGLRNGNHTLMA